jgi:Primase X
MINQRHSRGSNRQTSSIAYTDLDDTPNFLFIDIDSLDFSTVENLLNKCRGFAYFPTVLFTGSGYHIYQPVTAIRLEDISDLAAYRQSGDLSKQFLRFVAEYLADDKADANHHPSLKSCMVRIPGSINSKNGKEVKLVQEWNGVRPSIVPLLGIFYSWLASRKIIEEKSQSPNSKFRATKSSSKINWIEVLLKTYRKTIVNLVLAPYLVNIRRLAYEKAFEIIKQWLELCAAKRQLDFNVDSLISNALHNAKNSGYKPMRLDTLKTRNPEIYKELA